MALPSVNPERPAGEPRSIARRRPRGHGRAPLWPRWPGRRAVLALAALVPPPCARLPVLGVLRGPLGVLLAGPGRHRRWPSPPSVRRAAPGDPALAARPLRRRLGVPARRRALLHAAAARLRRRAALPADGPEPLARGRPRPARQPRARGLARVHAGPDRAALRRAARAMAGPYPAHSPGLPLLLAPALRARRARRSAWSR